MAQGFILEGQRYPWVALETLTVGEQIRLEHWLKSKGAPYTDARTYDEVQALAVEVDRLGDEPEVPDGLNGWERQKKHPDFKFSLAIAIWMAKRAAGEEVSPSDCMDWVWEDLDFWSDEDPTAGKG